MVGRKRCRQATIHLFGIRQPTIARAQSGLDVAYRNLLIEGRERRGRARRRITMNQNDIGTRLA